MKLRTLAAVMTTLGVTVACGPVPSGEPQAKPTVTVTMTSCMYDHGRADSRCTPGAINPEVTQTNIHSTICVPGWTKTIRPPASYTNQLKSVQLTRYDQPQQLGSYEEDHLIPLEIGGAPTNPDNLWPELWIDPEGAHTKDHEENVLHAHVCAGTMSLEVAQQTIVRDWTHG